MAHGAAHDAAEHVAAALVRRQHPVGDQERRRTQVIGDDAMGYAARVLGLDAGQVGDVGDDRAEQIDLVIVVGALQHRGDPLQPHAGVDRRLGQRNARLPGLLVVLHEDQVPDLDEPVALGLGGARRTARDVRAMVVEDFRARAAGAELAHLPEIVGAGDAQDPALGQPRDLLPQIERLVVVDEDSDRQPIDRQAELFGDEVPGKLDGAVLEVIAEREVAEHLEEGVMARGVADVLEVVVLAARAQAPLCGRRALVGPGFPAEKHVLELHHAGIGEEQRGIVRRHERARGDGRVALLLEELQELAADFRRLHVSILTENPVLSRECPRPSRRCRSQAFR